jgi:hypothetical protein
MMMEGLSSLFFRTSARVVLGCCGRVVLIAFFCGQRLIKTVNNKKKRNTLRHVSQSQKHDNDNDGKPIE